MDKEREKKVWLKLWGELSDARVQHFLKTSAKNEEKMSKDLYKAKTSGGEVHAHTCACLCD